MVAIHACCTSTSSERGVVFLSACERHHAVKFSYEHCYDNSPFGVQEHSILHTVFYYNAKHQVLQEALLDKRNCNVLRGASQLHMLAPAV